MLFRDRADNLWNIEQQKELRPQISLAADGEPTYMVLVGAWDFFNTHWGLVTPYGVGDLGQHWFR